jgi:hypothetical protein
MVISMSWGGAVNRGTKISLESCSTSLYTIQSSKIIYFTVSKKKKKKKEGTRVVVFVLFPYSGAACEHFV